jgi:hypothetical protein
MATRTSTTTRTRTSPRLSDSQVVEVLKLLGGADSAELKLTIPDEAQVATVRALNFDPLEAQIRQVFFFDTPDLELNKAGIVVRARRIQGKGNDSVVKLRPVIPDALPPGLRQSPNLVVEVDAGPEAYVCSATMKRALPSDAVREVLDGKKPIRRLFSKEQRAFYADHAPDGIPLDSLQVLGPIFVLKARVVQPESGRRMVGEMWLYPNGTRIMELSTKCTPKEAFQVAAEGRALLAARGIEITEGQQTKTATALRYFARQLVV